VRFFSYQNKRRIKICLGVLAAFLILFLLICICRYIYLQRYLVYVDGEVKIDYDQTIKTQPSDEKDWEPSSVDIIVEEPVLQTSAQAGLPLQKLTGYYITTQMLLDMDTVNSAISALTEKPDTLMLDLKSIYGNFYYSSNTTGAMTSSADIPAVDSLISQLSSDNSCYLVARVASLSDTNFALANQTCGLPLRSGALWMSQDGCYWLDPAKEEVQDYLVAIAQELAVLGFDEVVFDDFRIPDSTNIVYRGELTREEAAAEAAKNIRSRLSEHSIRVSFNSADPLVAEHSDRVYLVTEDGASVASLVEGVSACVEDQETEIVFLTASRDTRFDGYGILRPLIEERQE